MSDAQSLDGLFALALSWAQGGATRLGRRAIKQAVRVALTALIAAGCAATAIGCAIAALWIALLPYAGASGAPLAVAGVLIAACLCALAATRGAHQSRLPKSRLPAGAIPAELISQAVNQFKDHKGAALLAAILAGVIAGGNEK